MAWEFLWSSTTHGGARRSVIEILERDQNLFLERENYKKEKKEKKSKKIRKKPFYKRLNGAFCTKDPRLNPCIDSDLSAPDLSTRSTFWSVDFSLSRLIYWLTYQLSDLLTKSRPLLTSYFRILKYEKNFEKIPKNMKKFKKIKKIIVKKKELKACIFDTWWSRHLSNLVPMIPDKSQTCPNR